MMANLGSLLHSPGTQPSKHIEEKTAQLVVLRTETGAVYVRPSAWQRIRLQWIFRNFHVLSTQVLSRSDQRLIAQLAQYAVVTPDLPVSGTSVLGVIEKAHTRQAEVADPVFGAALAGDPPTRRLWNVNLGLVGALAAICVTVVLTSALASRTQPGRKAPPSPLTTLHPGPPHLDLASRAKRSGVEGPAVRPSLSTTLPSGPPADLSFPPQQSGVEGLAHPGAEPLPGAVAHPVVAQKKLDGEVQLKVLIGTDGAVKEVTVVRGDPQLAEAGMRAVRRWHYRPHEELGQPVEVERQVTMKFFGPDAVSIASVTNPTTAVLR